MYKQAWRVASALALITAIGCGDDDPSGPDPTITLSASPTSLTLPQGGSGTVVVTLVRGGGFANPVNVAVTGLPSGVTLSVTPAQLTGNTNQATVTVNVANTVPPATYTATVTATATGVGSTTATYTLTVTAAPTGSFTIAATPTALNLAAGASGNTSVAIVRTNLTTDVALSLVNPPTGITGVFTPATLTGATLTSTLALTVASNVGAGTYPVTVRGTAGSITQDATVTVTVPAPVGSFTISATPAALNLAAGASGNTSVAIVRTNFTTDVALSLVSPPAGITGVFTPATLTGTTLTSTLALSVASNVLAGSYPVTVRGTGGAITQNTTVTVTVPASASVSLAVSPATLTIQQGSSAQTTLSATRTNFTGDITPSVSGNPPGMTVSFSPTLLTGTATSTATVNVGSGVGAGNYTLTITGGGAPANPTTTLAVAVTPSTGNNITWEFCNTPNNVPVKFWVLSGATWTEVTSTVVGTVTRFVFALPSGSTGVAYTSSASGFSTTIVYFAQSTDLGSFAGVCTTPTTVQKTFNLTGQVGGEVGQLGYGGGSVATGAAASATVTVAPGTYDWLWAFGTSSGSPIPTTTFTNYRIGRSEATTAGAVSVNRTGAPAFVTAPFSFTGGSAGGFWQTSQNLSGANGQIAALSIGSILSGNGSGNMLFLQPGDRLGTDMWLLSATHLELDQTTGKGDSRTTARYVGSAPPASLTFALPGKVPAFTVASTTASIPWSATGSIPAEYQTAASTVAASFTGAGGNATATLIASRAWLVANNMSTTYTLTGPTLPNFLPAWAPTSPLTASSVIMVGTNLTGAPTAGNFLNTAVRIQ